MSVFSSVSQFSIDALLSGQEQLSSDWLQLLLPPHQACSETALAALFWSAWRRHSALHESFLIALEPLARALSRVPAAQWIGDAQHPLWPLLDLLQRYGVGYQPELARAGEKLLGDLASVWALLDAGDWAAAQAAAEQQWQQEQSRLHRLEQRLIDSERGLLSARRAQQQAARVLNRALAGKRLPAAMLAYLHDAWYRELQWCLLQFGEASEEWRRRADLTQRLVDSLQDPGADAERRQRLYAVIPEIGAELRETLAAHAPESSVLEQQLALIETHHLALLKGRPLPTVACTLLANNDPWLDESAALSRDLLQRVAVLEVGTWFLLRNETGETRIRLVLKMEDTAQLLFVNRVGIKALQKSFEEFAYLLAIDDVTPLPLQQARAVLRQLLAQMLQRGIERQRARAEEDQRAREEQQRKVEEEQRRHAAREKAMAEAAALAAAQEQVQAQARLEAERRAREQEQLRRQLAQQAQPGAVEQRVRNARQIATLIAIGSWVELHDEMGDVQRLRLAVKLPSSGKLIFVDREGVRRAEFERDAFAAKLVEGSALVLDAGPQFEDTLARVVGSLRRDRDRP